MNRTNCMAQHVKSYLALRRAFGFELGMPGNNSRTLHISRAERRAENHSLLSGLFAGLSHPPSESRPPPHDAC